MKPGAPKKKAKFLGWELTGRGQIKPVWPLPAGDQSESYVEIHYGADGEIIGIEEWVEGADKPIKRKPNFHDDGRLNYSDYEDLAEGLKGRNSYEYDERGFLCARQETAPGGRVRFRTLTRCDDKGRFVEESLTRRGKLVERHIFEYNAKGLLAKDSVYKGKKGQDLEGYFTFEYDDQGHIKRRAWIGPEGEERSAFSYKYDQHHRRTEMTLESDGQHSVTSRFERDANGKKLGVELFDADGNPVRGPGMPDEPLSTDTTTLAAAMAQPKMTMQDVIKVRQEDMAALSHLAYTNFEKGMFDQARALFESLAALDPKNPYYTAGVAASAFGLGQLNAALVWYERALTHDPKHLPSLVGKGETLLRLGDADGALGAFKKAFENSPAPDDPLILRARAIVLAMSKAKS